MVLAIFQGIGWLEEIGRTLDITNLVSFPQLTQLCLFLSSQVTARVPPPFRPAIGHSEDLLIDLRNYLDIDFGSALQLLGVPVSDACGANLQRPR